MSNKAAGVLRAIRNRLPQKQCVEVDGSIIPPPHRRWCGREFKDDNYYLRSAEGEANRLIKYLQCTNETRVLDVGCGQGRLPIGLIRVIGEMQYIGLDVDQISVNWCKTYIERVHPSFTFKSVNVYNERYNKSGERIDSDYRLDIPSGSIDIVYLFSVFSHTTEETMKVYLKDFTRILTVHGKLFFTCHVEENVPDVSVNPENYRLECSGPLHVVRYNKNHLWSILGDLGFSVREFTYATEADGQCAIYCERTNA